MDTSGRGFGGTDLGEGTFASGGGGQITRVSVGQLTGKGSTDFTLGGVFSGLGGWAPCGFV